MTALLIAFLLLFALAAMCPGPSEPAVKTEGCRCQHCQWYLHRRKECSDPAPHRLGYIFPRWSFASPRELVDAWQDGITDDLIQRSLAYVQEEVDRQVIADIINIRPMGPGPGPIRFLKSAA